PRVHAIRERIGECGAIAKDRPEVEQRAGRRGVWMRRPGWKPDEHEDERERGAEQTGDERPLPAEPRVDGPGDDERQRAADPHGRGMRGDGTRLLRAFREIAERLEPRHVAPGPADAHQRTEREGPPES